MFQILIGQQFWNSQSTQWEHWDYYILLTQRKKWKCHIQLYHLDICSFNLLFQKLIDKAPSKKHCFPKDPVMRLKIILLLCRFSPWVAVWAVVAHDWISRAATRKRTQEGPSYILLSAEGHGQKTFKTKSLVLEFFFPTYLTFVTPSFKSTGFFKCLQEIYWFYFFSLVVWNWCLFTRYLLCMLKTLILNVILRGESPEQMLKR